MSGLRLGIIGMSEGNGHPYSWAAIFNGYDPAAMETCQFPVIPQYLGQQRWPDAQISGAQVTHVWTQDKALSEKIAKAARIPNIVPRMTSLIGRVDAILLARDDANQHYRMARPFIDAGLPIYIDKPVCLSIKELKQIFSRQQYPGQVFSCSALKYANELSPSEQDLRHIGNLKHVSAMISNGWDRYAVHLIEPLLGILGDQGAIDVHKAVSVGEIRNLCLRWETGVTAVIGTLGAIRAPTSLRVIGDKGYRDFFFADTFAAFKAALQDFVHGIEHREVRTPYEHLQKVVDIIEKGRR